jgi:hypothetical protein
MNIKVYKVDYFLYMSLPTFFPFPFYSLRSLHFEYRALVDAWLSSIKQEQHFPLNASLHTNFETKTKSTNLIYLYL